jgi:hypothetical protein
MRILHTSLREMIVVRFAQAGKFFLVSDNTFTGTGRFSPTA